MDEVDRVEGRMLKNTEIAIDVDGTLINHHGEILPWVLEGLPKLFEHNTLYCWSHGGVDYARKVLKKHGLRKYFKKVIPKPFYVIDDLKNCGFWHIFPGQEVGGQWGEEECNIG